MTVGPGGYGFQTVRLTICAQAKARVHCLNHPEVFKLVTIRTYFVNGYKLIQLVVWPFYHGSISHLLRAENAEKGFLFSSPSRGAVPFSDFPM